MKSPSSAERISVRSSQSCLTQACGLSDEYGPALKNLAVGANCLLQNWVIHPVLPRGMWSWVEDCPATAGAPLGSPKEVNPSPVP